MRELGARKLPEDGPGRLLAPQGELAQRAVAARLTAKNVRACVCVSQVNLLPGLTEALSAVLTAGDFFKQRTLGHF